MNESDLMIRFISCVRLTSCNILACNQNEIILSPRESLL